MKKLLLLFAFLTLSVGLWAQTVGDCFTDDVSSLEFEVTAVGDNNTVMVIPNYYNGTDYTIPSFVTYQNVTFYVTAIGMLAFRASSLQSVTMPEGLTTIDVKAFYAAVNLQSVTIPASVNSIGKSAFADCSSLCEIVVSWTKESDIPKIDPNVFSGIASRAVLRVPAGTKALYQAADGWNDLEIYATLPTTYVDADGTSHDINALPVFDATYRVNWGEAGKTTWYVVNGTDMQLPKGAICNGDVRLILADGAKLTATGDVDPENQLAGILVSGEGNSLTIYGQTNQSGQLIATGALGCASIGGQSLGAGSIITINGGTITATGGTNAAGIGGGRVTGGNNIITINGGTITATGGTNAAGIGGGSATGGNNIITINGGTVTANGGARGAGIGGGYHGSGSNITINGGTVTANGGDSADGIGNGWNGSASSNITVATIFVVKADGNNPPTTVIENTGADLAGSLAGKRYVTVTDDVCNLTANQDPDHIKNYYSTFYSSKKAYKVPEGVTAYTGVVDGNVLKLTSITDGIIPAGEAVILRLTTAEDNTAATKQQIALTATTTTATKSNDNALTGTDVAKTLGANQYALSLGQNGVGFYLWDGKSIDAHKAYLTLGGSEAKAFSFQFDDGETMAIEQPTINGKQSSDTYNLNGVRVNDNYKGIVIKNGRKIYWRGQSE